MMRPLDTETCIWGFLVLLLSVNCRWWVPDVMTCKSTSSTELRSPLMLTYISSFPVWSGQLCVCVPCLITLACLSFMHSFLVQHIAADWYNSQWYTWVFQWRLLTSDTLNEASTILPFRRYFDLGDETYHYRITPRWSLVMIGLHALPS